MRVISLLPAATEIVAALDMLDSLVGVSHECDHPEDVNFKPRVTRCAIHDAHLPSAQVDHWVRTQLQTSGTLYTLDEERIRKLQPDLILTQRLCDVCAVDYGTVACFAATLPGPPRIVNLEPTSVEDILQNIRSVAEALGVPDRAEKVIASLVARIDRVRGLTADAPKRRCVLLEWIDPLFCAGHWVPELIDIAGGFDPLGRRGRDSAEIPWEAVLNAEPEVLVIACCGYSIERTLQDLPLLRSRMGFDALPAVRQGEVYIVDANSYFSRPGPRIVDSLEILSEILHPERFRDQFPKRSVLKVRGLDGLQISATDACSY